MITELHRRGHDRLHAVENPLTSLADDAERTRRRSGRSTGPSCSSATPTAAPSSPRRATCRT
ncbi:hypothetical protein [Streptomyces sp. SJL17-1]|uniref:hypothetical protein n=1 Tax=Streptomyces sp. SJL17-1 TaxID=2967223 RepID=UPI0039900118